MIANFSCKTTTHSELQLWCPKTERTSRFMFRSGKFVAIHYKGLTKSQYSHRQPAMSTAGIILLDTSSPIPIRPLLFNCGWEKSSQSSFVGILNLYKLDLIVLWVMTLPQGWFAVLVCSCTASPSTNGRMSSIPSASINSSFRYYKWGQATTHTNNHLYAVPLCGHKCDNW